MKVCPILQSMNNHPQACLTDLCEWWQNGCPAHPYPPEPPQVLKASNKKPPPGEPKSGRKGL